MPDPVCRRPELASRSPVSVFRHPVAMAACFLLVLLAPDPALAQSDVTDKLTALRVEWLTQLARQDAATWEADLIAAPRETGLSVGNFRDPNAVLKELGPVLNRDYVAVRNRLVTLDARAKLKREEVQKEWAEVYRQRAAFRQYAEKQQAAYGFGFESGTPVGFQFNILDALLLLWALAVALIGLRLRMKEKRLEIRRARRAVMTAGLFVALCGLPGCGGPQSIDARPWSEREEGELTTAVKEATESANTATTLANQKWQSAVDGWAKLVAAPTGTVEAEVQRGEAEIRDRLRNVMTETRLADRLAKDAEEQRTKLADEKARLDRLEGGARWRSIAVATFRIVMAVTLFVLAIAPYWMARRARRAALRLAARTCPRCFRLDTLKVERTGARREEGGAISSSRRGRKPAPKPVEPQEPGDAEVVCNKCGLRFRKSYLRVPRLCFPAVGVRSSGKTHMLATAYDRVRKRTVPTVATVQPAKSTNEGEAERRFEQFIHLIVNLRGEAGATDRTLPNPILVHVKDTDPKGPNGALVNLFDYSGELVNRDVDVNQLKATAVRMDGFMLFLDPTQLYGEEAKVTLEEQLSMLDEFLAEIRKQRKVPVGGAVPVPVAVCIPKFDLLLTENPISGQAVPFTRYLLEQLTPGNPRETSLAMIRERSDVVEQMLPMMFPGVDVREIVEGYFGRQVMFFPISSVNLIESELGIKDLARRSAIVPYGVAEPIVWLLHMHGYEVFAG